MSCLRSMGLISTSLSSHSLEKAKAKSKYSSLHAEQVQADRPGDQENEEKMRPRQIERPALAWNERDEGNTGRVRKLSN